MGELVVILALLIYTPGQLLNLHAQGHDGVKVPPVRHALGHIEILAERGQEAVAVHPGDIAELEQHVWIQTAMIAVQRVQDYEGINSDVWLTDDVRLAHDASPPRCSWALPLTEVPPMLI